MKTFQIAIAICAIASGNLQAQTPADASIHSCFEEAGALGLSGNDRTIHVRTCTEKRQQAERQQQIEQAKQLIHPMPLSPKQAAARILQAQNATKDLLNDPGSAQFKQVQYHPETGAVCGMFNGKNAMGGYPAFQPFAYDSEAHIYAIQDVRLIHGQNAGETLALLQVAQKQLSVVQALCKQNDSGSNP